MRGLDLNDVFIWFDILSISQKNETQKRLAVNSLYMFARQADALVIIAPDSFHQNLGAAANASTYRSRVWCRAEQVSFFCSNGLEHMYPVVIITWVPYLGPPGPSTSQILGTFSRFSETFLA